MKGPLHAIRRRRSERPANGVDTAQAAPEAPTEAQPTAGLSSAPPPPASAPAQPTAEMDTVAQPPPGTVVPPARSPSPTARASASAAACAGACGTCAACASWASATSAASSSTSTASRRVNTTLVDGKLHALERGRRRVARARARARRPAPLTELREPGISVCSRCGALHGSEARFCPSCGTPVHGARARSAEVGEA
jgi:ribosomal protein L32